MEFNFHTLHAYRMSKHIETVLIEIRLLIESFTTLKFVRVVVCCVSGGALNLTHLIRYSFIFWQDDAGE